MYRVGICNDGGENDSLEDGVVGEIDADELGTSIRGGDLGTVGGESTTGVENPEPVFRVNYYRLDAD